MLQGMIDELRKHIDFIETKLITIERLLEENVKKKR